MKRSVPKSVPDYLRTLSPDQRRALQRVRRIVRAAVPDAQEKISYGMPCFGLNGRWLAGYSAFERHCSFFPGAYPIAVCKADLREFKTSKGTIRFTPDHPLPAALVRKLVRARIREMAGKEKKRRG